MPSYRCTVNEVGPAVDGTETASPALAVGVRRIEHAALALLPLIFAILFASAAQAACNPGADQAAFFKDANFAGSCSVRGVGNYPNADAIGLPNDSISSVKLGANVQVVLCKDVNFGGDCILLKASESFVHDNRVGNDNTTSLKVQPLGFAECIPSANQVSFYINADFLGSCVVRAIGDYPNSGAIGLPDNSISAIRVGANVQVVVCKDIGFQGDCILVTADVPFVNDSRVGNDQISSAKVQVRGASECQPAENQASFFTNADFLGSCVVKNIGDYPTSEAIGLPNDSISSVRVGGKAQVEICNDVQFKGDCILLTSDARFLSGDRVPNDSITALKVQPRGARDCVPRANQASFFMHADFLAPCVSLGIGDYNDHTHIGLDDKSISSLELGPGAQACICTGENFGTQCSKYTSDSTLIAENDLVSSLKVQMPGALCQAVAATPPAATLSAAVIPSSGNFVLSITGTNFGNNEPVHIAVVWSVVGEQPATFPVLGTANSLGEFSVPFSGVVPEGLCPITVPFGQPQPKQTFQITATGQTSHKTASATAGPFTCP